MSLSLAIRSTLQRKRHPKAKTEGQIKSQKRRSRATFGSALLTLLARQDTHQSVKMHCALTALPRIFTGSKELTRLSFLGAQANIASMCRAVTEVDEKMRKDGTDLSSGSLQYCSALTSQRVLRQGKDGDGQVASQKPQSSGAATR